RDSYEVVVSKRGYREQRQAVSLRQGDTGSHFVLRKLAQTLPGPGADAATPPPTATQPRKAALKVVVKEFKALRQTVPVRGASVTVRSEGRTIDSQQTTVAGIAIFFVEPGNYQVDVSSPNFNPGQGSVTVPPLGAVCPINMSRPWGESQASPAGPQVPQGGMQMLQTVVRLNPTLTVSVVESSARGRGMVPLPGATVTVFNQQTNQEVGRGPTDAAGCYRISLAPGTYRVQAQAGNHHPGAILANVGQLNVSETIRLQSSVKID
ncbi:MAG: carboxypeptidase-like regulatory domain-containing protein, partial [Planctomycetota bacterium]